MAYMMGGGMMGRGMGGMMGSGTANAPKLEGQHAAYIVDQLNRFSTGERQGTVMNRVALQTDPIWPSGERDELLFRQDA